MGLESHAYLKALETKSSFNRKELFDVMHSFGMQVSEALFKVKLQNHLKEKRIVRVGRNAYSIPNGRTHIYEHEYSELAANVVETATGCYPLMDFTVFETVQLNEFVNHQLAHNAVFLYAESSLGDFVFDALKEAYPGKVLINPTPDVFHKYWYDNMIIIGKLITESPRGRCRPWATRLEKLLVDIVADPLLSDSVGRAECQIIFENAFLKYAVDESCLFRYAKRRGADKKILQLIHQDTDIQLKTRR